MVPVRTLIKEKRRRSGLAASDVYETVVSQMQGTQVVQEEISDRYLMVRFLSFRQTCTQASAFGSNILGGAMLVCTRVFLLRHCDVHSPTKSAEWKRFMSDHLSDMRIAEEADHQGIIDIVFQVAQLADCNLPIYVKMNHITIQSDDEDQDIAYRGDLDLDLLRAQTASMDAYRAKLVPATKTSIDSLPKVSLVANCFQASSECAVCLHTFDIDRDSESSDITRLPCQHCYHTHCIVPWLEINHLCPVCRRPIESLN